MSNTGFSTGEVDLLMDSTVKSTAADPADDLTHFGLDGPAVSRPGDVWELGRHRLVCGDALRPETYVRLLGGDTAQMVATDPPYNVRIHGHVTGRGRM